MPKIYTEHELCEKRIEELKKTLHIIEDNIIDYNNKRGCIWYFMVCCNDKEYIKNQYIMQKTIRDELSILQRAQSLLNSLHDSLHRQSVD
jgi:hypothetical protein